MAVKIAVAGKGGTGKTTLTGMIIRYLVENKLGSILAVDADTNSNLHDVLGIEVTETIGNARETMRTDVPEGMPKDTYIEYKVQEAVNEADGFDLLVMGTPEGQGCYCAANTLCKKYIDVLLDNYDYIVIDNEAGMEHMSRLLTKDIDYFFIISDPSMRGLQTIKRIKELSEALKLNIGKYIIIVNRVRGEIPESAKAYLDKEGVTPDIYINEDEKISELDMEGKPTYQLPEDSVSLKKMFSLLDKLFKSKN
jgi:CO dehydrogenase maturation factor